LASLTSCRIQKTAKSDYNLDFEKIELRRPTGWQSSSSAYKITADSINRVSGKYSLSFNYDKEEILYYQIPNYYRGKKITLSGYLKTENATDKVRLRINVFPPASEQTKKQEITGTTDWTKHVTTLNLNPRRAHKITVVASLNGSGRIWLDNLQIEIDGKNINNIESYKTKYPAQTDIEFDSGSRISSISLNNNNMENIKTLALVWGFLKYYHPNIAAGEYNMDAELFRILPKILDVSMDKRDEILMQWINDFGSFQRNRVSWFQKLFYSKKRLQSLQTITNSANIRIKPDLSWINENRMSKKLVAKLLKIKDARRINEHYYLTDFTLRKYILEHENNYLTMKYPDTGLRLLTLFRYWNVVQYFYPYKNLIEKDWIDVLNEFIPQFVAANNETEYLFAVLKLASEIHDTNAYVWEYSKNLDEWIVPERLNRYLGMNQAAIEIRFVEGKAVVTGFLRETSSPKNAMPETGLQIGDIILAINNNPVENIIKERLKIASGANNPVKLRNIAFDLLRTNDSLITVDFVRNGAKTTQLKTYPYDKLLYDRNGADTCLTFVRDDIAWLDPSLIPGSKDFPAIWEKVKNTKGIIIDLRLSFDFLVFFKFLENFVPRSTDFVKIATGNIINPGEFSISSTFNIPKRTNDTNCYKGKLIVIMDETTRDRSEYVAMAFKAIPNATIIGSVTPGSEDMLEIHLPGGLMSQMSNFGVYSPDGTLTQRASVMPDIEVYPTIKGIAERRDELLEKAIEIIDLHDK
jgi:membrane-associated protease RseP (regulator of RpoE activity)